MIVVNLRHGPDISEVRCQRLNPDPVIEGNLILEGVGSLELRLNNGDRLLPHTMSIPKGSVVGYYGGELITVEVLAEQTEAHLKELSLKKSAETPDDPVREWRGIEGTTFTA